jgi:ABC-2 type transport system permease protein
MFKRQGETWSPWACGIGCKGGKSGRIMNSTLQHAPNLGPNWVGFRTLYEKEVRRFLNVYVQTTLAPCVTTLLFLAVFVLALGQENKIVDGVTLAQFLAPGLIIMSMAQNAFANNSSSIITQKMQGNIVDLLMPPLSAGEIAAAYALVGITRGLVVGLASGLAIWAFVPTALPHPFYVLFHGIAGSLMLGSIGLLAGLWAEKFDQLATVTNFIVTPFAFLSGTFYSIHQLPGWLQQLAHFNPFFYMIDGFRYGFIDHSDGALWPGLLVMVGTNLALWLLSWRLLASGYKVKS